MDQAISMLQVYEGKDLNPKLIAVGLFPIIPFVSWEYKFIDPVLND